MKNLFLAALLLQSAISLGRGSGSFGPPPAPLVTAAYTGQECDNSNTYSGSLSCSITPTGTGHLLLIAVSDQDAGTLSSISSSAGGTASLAVSCPTWANGSNSGSVWYIKNAAGGAQTITSSYSGATYLSNLMVIDISGASTTAPIDASNCSQNSSGTNPADSGAVTTTNASDLFIGMFATHPPSGQSVVGPAGTGFTLIAAATTGARIGSEYKALSSIGTYNATVTVGNGGSTQWLAAGLAVK